VQNLFFCAISVVELKIIVFLLTNANRYQFKTWLAKKSKMKTKLVSLLIYRHGACNPLEKHLIGEIV
jgi:hypothetical protein